MKSCPQLEAELHSQQEVSLTLLSAHWSPKVQDPTYLQADLLFHHTTGHVDALAGEGPSTHCGSSMHRDTGKG